MQRRAASPHASSCPPPGREQGSRRRRRRIRSLRHRTLSQTAHQLATPRPQATVVSRFGDGSPQARAFVPQLELPAARARASRMAAADGAAARQQQPPGADGSTTSGGSEGQGDAELARLTEWAVALSSPAAARAAGGLGGARRRLLSADSSSSSGLNSGASVNSSVISEWLTAACGRFGRLRACRGCRPQTVVTAPPFPALNRRRPPQTNPVP
jgi:hypothetical protein